MTCQGTNERQPRLVGGLFDVTAFVSRETTQGLIDPRQPELRCLAARAGVFMAVHLKLRFLGCFFLVINVSDRLGGVHVFVCVCVCVWRSIVIASMVFVHFV